MKIPISVTLKKDGKEMLDWIAPVDEKQQPPAEFMVVFLQHHRGFRAFTTRISGSYQVSGRLKP